MMSFVYKVKRLDLGDTVTLTDMETLVGSTVESDGRGGFRMVVHILERTDQPELSNRVEMKEVGQ